MEDPVPALAEAEATGEAAAIFADIRAVLGVGVVNLIWRHLATIPGALPWAWGALRPHYRDGGLAAAAAALRTRTAPPDLPAIPPEVLAAAGLGPGDRARIAGVWPPTTGPTRWRWSPSRPSPCGWRACRRRTRPVGRRRRRRPPRWPSRPCRPPGPSLRTSWPWSAG